MFDSSNILDCSAEQVAVRTVPDSAPTWIISDLKESDWKINLHSDALEEVHQLARFFLGNPVGSLQRRIDEFAVPGLREQMAALKTCLDRYPGFGVIAGLPIDDYPIETIVEIYWVIGQLIGPQVAQKWDGEMLYHVHDSGARYEYGVRGSRTAVELLFHTDNAFGRVVPDYVGLLCRHPAKQGGTSRFCSLYTLHQRLEIRHPELLARLYQPMLFDRQKEHAQGAPPVTLAPFFSWKNGKLSARANTSLVRKGYQVAAQKPDASLVSALDAVDIECQSADLWFEAPLQRGDIQYLNNHEVGHYRSEFIDFDEPDKKRHLYRLWHREEGSVCYDGIKP